VRWLGSKRPESAETCVRTTESCRSRVPVQKRTFSGRASIAQFGISAPVASYLRVNSAPCRVWIHRAALGTTREVWWHLRQELDGPTHAVVTTGFRLSIFQWRF